MYDLTMKNSSSGAGALVSLSLSILLASLSASIANVALPTLVQAFHASFHEVQWVILAYLLAVTTLIVSVGRIGDISGHRRLLLVGISLFTVASVLCGIAPTLWLLVVARMLQGLGAAIMLVIAMAFVSETVPKPKIGSAMGVLATMSAIGTALGPSLGGFLIFAFGWRAIFFVTAPMGILMFFLAYRYLPVDHRKPKTESAGLDIRGMLILAMTLGAYALAMTIGHGNFGPLNLTLLISAIFGAFLFMMVEARAPSPLIKLEVFHNPVLSGGFIMSVLVLTVMMAIFVVGPFYLSQALGLDTAHVGIVMSVGPLAAALTGIPAGRLTDRFGARFITILGLIAISVGSFVLSVFPAGIVAYAAWIAVISCGYALFQTGNNTMVMTNIQPDQRGVVSGLLNLSRNLGLITGASVMAALFAFASGTSDKIAAMPEAIAFGMQITFVVATGLIVAALTIALAGHQRILSRIFV
jgi:EmrB/QacA subfamily drug resistance transporter